MKKPKLLIIEDEEPIRQGLVDVFLYHGFEVDVALDGITGLEKATTGSYDLVILDIMLPGLDGFSVCNEIRNKDCDLPIVMLTAKTSDEDIVTGLTLGADDYVAKPFSVRQLVLRVEAILKRARKVRSQLSTLVVGNLAIDVANLRGHFVHRSTEKAGASTEIVFTRREIEILQYLIDNRERPVSREELLSEVWSYSRAQNIETRTVDIHIAKLRRKIESDPKRPVYLVTVRGEGYRLEGEETKSL